MSTTELTTEVVTEPATTAVQSYVEPQGGVYALAALPDEQFQARLAMMVKGRERVQQIQRAAMTEGVHFGKIPGAPKPTLFKPGAELLCQMYRLVPEFKVVTTYGDGVTAPHISVHADCSLHIADADGPVVGVGVGNCNSWETKYRYRDAQRVCPQCGVAALFFSKSAKFGPFAGKPSYWCSDRKGGCRENFAESDPRIAGQVVGRVDNPDPFDLANTLEKMACKRAYVDSTLRATATSDLFTQDEEHRVVKGGDAAESDPYAEYEQEQKQAVRTTKPRTAGRTEAPKERKEQRAAVASSAEVVEDKPAPQGTDLQLAQRRLWAVMRKLAESRPQEFAYLALNDEDSRGRRLGFLEQYVGRAIASSTDMTPAEMRQASNDIERDYELQSPQEAA